MVETREHELARLAVEDCLSVAQFGDVLILTDDPRKFDPLVRFPVRVRFKIVPDWPDKLGWSRAWWFDVPPLLRTSQTLNIQWDSWICDPTMWRDEFLRYDFIGAPWWYKDGKNVGNGGFCLKSARLARYIYKHRDKFPCDTNVDDDLLCRKYRPKLEEVGFLWAPEKVAHDFAFECCRPSKTSKHFGFHALFNWPDVLDIEPLRQRLEIALASPYIRDGYMVKALCDKHPDVVNAMDEQIVAARKIHQS
jgi:hypothetical protein